jgi:GT2 family glycosyltransferase
MALIAMAVHDTDENGRSKYTHKTLNTIYQTVDLDCNRLIIVDNNSCQETKHIISEFLTCTNTNVDVIELDENIGTAKAINKAWALRKPKEHLIKKPKNVQNNDCCIVFFIVFLVGINAKWFIEYDKKTND